MVFCKRACYWAVLISCARPREITKPQGQGKQNNQKHNEKTKLGGAKFSKTIRDSAETSKLKTAHDLKSSSGLGVFLSRDFKYRLKLCTLASAGQCKDLCVK